MKSILICHSRSGSTNLINSIRNNTDKNITFGVDNGKPWSLYELINNDYDLCRCMVHDHSLDDLKYLSKNFNCIFLYRQDAAAASVSLCIGDLTGVWEYDKASEGFYENELVIDYDHYYRNLQHISNSRYLVKFLSNNGECPVIRYEELYKEGVFARRFLSDINDFCDLSIDIDGAEQQLKSTKKLNNYTNIKNIKDIERWGLG